MKLHPPNSELRKLVDRIHDGPPLGKTEMARLEELLEDSEALSYYLSVTQHEGLLEMALAETTRQAAPVRRPLRIPWIPISLAAAAAVVFCLGLGTGLRLAPGVSTVANRIPDSPLAAARVTGLVGVEWLSGLAPDLLQQGAASQRIAIKTGLVELTYGSGVRVTLEGPADYEITDAVSGRLDQGKLYATVPKGAEGFRVDYGRGSVVDLGTEFAMEARADGSTEVGVFDGEVELHRPDQDPFSIFENQALVHVDDSGEPIQAVPLDRNKFVRKLPSRDFSWELLSPEAREITIDVTHLIWKPSEYRAIFKWMQGVDSIVVRDVRLCLDGEVVVRDDHSGTTGVLRKISENSHALASGNIYALDVAPGQYRRGRWTIMATIEAGDRNGVINLHPSPAKVEGPVESRGILQLEEGLATSATAEDFIGRWSYWRLGFHYVREFHGDGRLTLWKDGERQMNAFNNTRWRVENGVLSILEDRYGILQDHVLRDPETLISVCSCYENAVKLTGE